MGLDVVDDADVEAEEEDLEVKRVFDAAKEKHRKIMTGMYVIVVNSMHVGEVEDTLYKCNALNGTNVGEVEDASMCHGIKISLHRMTLVHPYLVARAAGPSYSP